MVRVTTAALIAAALLIPVPAADAVELKIATLAPDGSYWMNEARAAADEVAERTSGRVSFRFYPGGTMGDDSAVLRKMRIGQLHGGVFLAGSLGQVAPDIQVYSLPLLFASYDEVDAVRSRVDADLVAALDAAGYHTFGFIEGGFAYLYTTGKVAGFDDLKGRKAWLPEGDPIGRVLIKEASLSPVPLGLSDVLTGLQTGLIDVVTGPPVGAVALQWFTKVRYMLDVPVIYTHGLVAIADRAWESVAPADRDIVDDVFSRMTRKLDQRAREDNRAALQALGKQGVEMITTSDATKRQWQAMAARASAALVQELDLSRALVDRVDAILDSYRRRASAGDAGPR
ncbi:MAG TPA: TRAP transporter substrate-binding protein DctP [Candidatus Sulfomarinibacteraceae bacterium]|nr:TRAP transporter substrate-binding protein DctP [Candidatus Sulfomarinibacteraceae bacterium]